MAGNTNRRTKAQKSKSTGHHLTTWSGKKKSGYGNQASHKISGLDRYKKELTQRCPLGRTNQLAQNFCQKEIGQHKPQKLPTFENLPQPNHDFRDHGDDIGHAEDPLDDNLQDTDQTECSCQQGDDSVFSMEELEKWLTANYFFTPKRETSMPNFAIEF